MLLERATAAPAQRVLVCLGGIDDRLGRLLTVRSSTVRWFHATRLPGISEHQRQHRGVHPVVALPGIAPVMRKRNIPWPIPATL